MAADVFDRLLALLSEAKANFRVIEHAAEGRSEAISVIRGNRPEQAAKAMVLDLRGGGGGRRHVLAILPGNRKLDFAAMDPAKVRIPPYQPDTPEMRALLEQGRIEDILLVITYSGRTAEWPM